MSPLIAIVGSNGLLGQNLAHVIALESSARVICAGFRQQSIVEVEQPMYVQLDITDRVAVKEFALRHHPATIVNCAGMNDVDTCETERERAWRINVKGVENLVSGCRAVDARLVHFSSDYVFDGEHPPYCEHDKPAPLSYYGKTKLASENACRMGGIRFAIIRTALLYGTGIGVRENFVQRVLRLLTRNEQFHAATDQTGNPTSAGELATAAIRVIERRCEGVYHIAGPDIVSRYEFARAIANVFDLDSNLVVPVSSAGLFQKALRPANAGLITLKAESELGVRLSGIPEGLTLLKRHLKLVPNAHLLN